MISLLHISDYHAGGTQEGQPYLRKRVLGEPWLRNLDTLQEQGAIHYILFTGDCANHGKARPSARELWAQQAGGHPHYHNLLGKYLRTFLEDA